MRTRKGGNKSLYFIIFVLIVVLFVYAWNQHWLDSFFEKKEESKQLEEKKTDEPAKKEYNVVTKEVNEEGKGSAVMAEYPSFGAPIDSKIKGVVDLKINDFKNSLSDVTVADDQFINISFSTFNHSRSVYSVKYEIVYGGGVHPVEDVECHTYDLDASKELLVTDIFKTDSGYLSKLSELVYMELLKDKTVDKDWVKEGTSAKVDNFKNFVLEKESISFYFAPGVVAPNTAGVKSVSIPLSSLKYFLNNSFN